MLREPYSPSNAPLAATSPAIPAEKTIQIRALRRKGWTLNSLAKRFEMPVKDIEKACGPDL